MQFFSELYHPLLLLDSQLKPCHIKINSSHATATCTCTNNYLIYQIYTSFFLSVPTLRGDAYIRYISLYIEKIYIVSGCMQLPEIELLRLQGMVIEKHRDWVKLEDSWASLVLELVDASLLLYRHHFLVWNFTIGAEITRLMVCTLRIFFSPFDIVKERC